MPVPKLTCPECQTVLKPTKPLPEGKKVICPKCGAAFAAGLARAADKAPAVAAKKPKAATKPKPTAKKKRDDEDADFETYGVIREEGDDDEDGKPKIQYAPDLSVKDPRGPAQAEVITPTNALLGIGILSCLLLVVGLSWAVFPFLFSDYVVDHKEFLDDYYKKKNDAKHKTPEQRKDLSAADKGLVDAETDLQVQLRVTLIAMFVAGLVYYAVVAIAAVKMQQLESYRWAVVGAIMAMIPFNLIGLLTIPIFDLDDVPWATIMVAIPCALMLPLGIWSFVLLRNPKVRAGFEYVPE
jgi:hypothetical protein